MTINIPATYTTGSILPLVEEQIHFDSLLEQAEEVLTAQAAKTWTDKEEHDPGITLLQALCFGVSDLAYRHTLPLTDLLTPPDPAPGAGIFPIAFGPQQALTCGPVTADDYRRALLDLHTPPKERLVAPDAATLDRFGSAVCMNLDGDILAIGAPGKAGGGMVYLFQRDGQNWEPLEPLPPSEPCTNFGAWISLSADCKWLAATADTSEKVIYLFELLEIGSAHWKDPQKITNAAEGFGFTLSFSTDGATLAVSALQADSQGEGEVYVYRNVDDTWGQVGEPLKRPGSAYPYSGFGCALSLNADGTTLAVGSPWTDSSVGEVWVFDLSQEASTWQSTAEKITVGDGVARKFGFQVCLNAEGDILVVRAPGENYLSRSAIYCCYSRGGSDPKWHAPEKISDGYIGGDRYSSMSLNGTGTVLALSHPGVAGAGAVYVWNYDNEQWNAPIEPIVAVDAGPGDEFACAVSLSEDGNVLAIGARNKDVDWQTNSGAAYIFHGDEIRQKRRQADAANDETLQGAGYFYLRDAQLVKETPEEQYHYLYNTETREFLFKKENEDDDDAIYQSMHLLGGYHLYLELSRHTDKALAESAVALFLENHRNLCERVNEITWLDPEDVDVNIVIELDDDCQQYARVMAQIFTVTEAFVSPSALRYSAADLTSQGFDNDTIYQGPRLQYGWIPELLPAPDYGNRQHVNISLLANKLLAIEGVRSINKLYFENAEGEPSWDWSASDKGKCLRLWGESPFETLAAHDGPVRLLKRGQIVFPLSEDGLTPEDIENELETPALVHESSMLLPYGLWRRPGQHYPVSRLIPPCYGLQHTEPDPLQIQLHQDLLPYEQILSDGCQQLAMLPQLLAFDRDDKDENGDATIWGGQWPFPPQPPGEIDIPNDVVHKDYEGELKDISQAQRQDNDKELALIDYLLGYFGNSRAARILQTGTEEEFLAVQRYYLAQMTDLTYDRASFRIDALSAFQRRIAARLGWGAALFSGSSIEDMPFYIIEHRSLLPTSMPHPVHDDPMEVTSVELNAEETVLNLISVGVARLQPGQWINLGIATIPNTPSDYSDIFTNVLVKQSTTDEAGRNVITVNLEQNERLKLNKDAIRDAAPLHKLFWINCNVWLYDMQYPLSYDSAAKQTLSGFKQLNADPYPATLKVGDWIVVKPSDDSPSRNVASEQGERARVSKVYPLTKKFVVEDEGLPADASGYVWYLDREGIEDRFSFVVSVVFDINLLKNVEDPNSAIDWIKQIIQEEIPCHISAQVHWLDFNAAGSNFPAIYRAWYNNGKPLGDLAYALLDILGLGQQQAVQKGIGAMRIASEEQRTEVIGESGNEWNEDKIKQHELLYVPPSNTKGAGK